MKEVEHASKLALEVLADTENFAGRFGPQAYKLRACDNFELEGVIGPNGKKRYEPFFGSSAAYEFLTDNTERWPRCKRCVTAILEALSKRAENLNGK